MELEVACQSGKKRRLPPRISRLHCQAIGRDELGNNLKAPSRIEWLSAEHCRELNIDGVFRVGAAVHARQALLRKIVAVVRPEGHISCSASTSLDQKYIMANNLEMTLKVRREAEEDHRKVQVYSERITPSSHKGLHGLYIFSVELPKLCQVAGVYMFSFALSDLSLKKCKKRLLVTPSSSCKCKKRAVISPQNQLVSVSIPCQDTPRSIQYIISQCPIQEKHLLPGFVVKELVLEVFDAYDNHVEEGVEVQLNVVGFQILDHFGSKLKVDDNGCIDLSGLLKVTAGFGKAASISISFHEHIVFNQEFQIDQRELITASMVPEFCTPGSRLENIVFEVVNSEGDVDGTIHNDDESGQSHWLTIKSDSFKSENCIQYAFSRGSCTVPAITVPAFEGIFCFVATHSSYPELLMTSKVSVVKTLELETEEVQSEHSFDKEPYSIYKYAERIGDLENGKMKINQVISRLQAFRENYLFNNPNYQSRKEEIMEQIKRKSHSAAALLCHLYGDSPFQEHQKGPMEGVVGMVALLGIFRTKKLSRILAEYLGEDSMLAVVCSSYELASALEEYAENGEVVSKLGLHAVATDMGKSICGRFLVICLEDIRPYTGELEGSDPQRKLVLPDPVLPDGNIVSGFLGYAVNMVNIDIGHLDVRTVAGHGLRETLFYHLFGELQVYETRVHLRNARAFIKNGAVSLDGGIFREKGVMSLGYGNPEICFPVVTIENEVNPSQVEEIDMQLEVKMEELHNTVDQIEQVSRLHEKSMRKQKRK